MTPPVSQLRHQLTNLTHNSTYGCAHNTNERTNGLTKKLTNPPLKSFTSVPHARIPNDHEVSLRTAALRARHTTATAATR